MTTVDFITGLFCRVDDRMQDVPHHPQAHLYPSEVVTLALLFALKGVGDRAFYRWLVRDYRPLFPGVPERTRLFRLFVTHQDWAKAFLADPSFQIALQEIRETTIMIKERAKLPPGTPVLTPAERARQEVERRWRRRVDRRLERHVARNHNDSDTAFADRLPNRDFNAARHLLRAGDQSQ